MTLLYTLVAWTLVGMVTVGLLNVAKSLVRSGAGPTSVAAHHDSGAFGAGAAWPPPLAKGSRRAA